MNNARRNAFRVHPNPYPARDGGPRASGESENWCTRKGLLAGLVVTELVAEVVVADDFLPTEPAWRVEA